MVINEAIESQIRFVLGGLMPETSDASNVHAQHKSRVILSGKRKSQGADKDTCIEREREKEKSRSTVSWKMNCLNLSDWNYLDTPCERILVVIPFSLYRCFSLLSFRCPIADTSTRCSRASFYPLFHSFLIFSGSPFYHRLGRAYIFILCPCALTLMHCICTQIVVVGCFFFLSKTRLPWLFYDSSIFHLVWPDAPQSFVYIFFDFHVRTYARRTMLIHSRVFLLLLQLVTFRIFSIILSSQFFFVIQPFFEDTESFLTETKHIFLHFSSDDQIFLLLPNWFVRQVNRTTNIRNTKKNTHTNTKFSLTFAVANWYFSSLTVFIFDIHILALHLFFSGKWSL